jgi:hypothetical protein
VCLPIDPTAVASCPPQLLRVWLNCAYDVWVLYASYPCLRFSSHVIHHMCLIPVVICIPRPPTIHTSHCACSGGIGCGGYDGLGAISSAAMLAWPRHVPVEFIAFESGVGIHTGLALARAHPKTSPCRRGYERFCALMPGWCETEGRASWDLMAVMYAVRDTEGLYQLEAGYGKIVAATGANYWMPAWKTWLGRIGASSALLYAGTRNALMWQDSPPRCGSELWACMRLSPVHPPARSPIAEPDRSSNRCLCSLFLPQDICVPSSAVSSQGEEDSADKCVDGLIHEKLMAGVSATAVDDGLSLSDYCWSTLEKDPWVSVQLVATLRVGEVLVFVPPDADFNELMPFEVWVASKAGAPRVAPNSVPCGLQTVTGAIGADSSPFAISCWGAAGEYVTVLLPGSKRRIKLDEVASPHTSTHHSTSTCTSPRGRTHIHIYGLYSTMPLPQPLHCYAAHLCGLNIYTVRSSHSRTPRPHSSLALVSHCR